MRRSQISEIVKSRSPFEQDGVIGYDSASFARGDRLVDLEAIDGNVGHGTQRAALVTGTNTLRAVFDHAAVVLFRHWQNSIHIARITLQMDHHDGFRLGSDLTLDIGRIDIEGFVNL